MYKGYKCKKWSEDELNFLLENYINLEIKDLAIKLNTTYNRIRYKLKSLGIYKNRIINNYYNINNECFLKIIFKDGSYINSKIDKENIEILKTFKWGISGTSKYISCTINKKIIYLHRLVSNALKDDVVDHIDGDIYNNTLSNLRLVTTSLNCQNKTKIMKNSQTGYYNLNRNTINGKKYYQVQVKIRGKNLVIKTCKNIEPLIKLSQQCRAYIFKNSKEREDNLHLNIPIWAKNKIDLFLKKIGANNEI